MNVLLPLMRCASIGLILFLGGCQRYFIVQQTQTQQYIFDKAAQPAETDIDNFIKPYRDSLDAQMSRVLAFSEAELIKKQTGKDLNPSQVAMGNFMVDACMMIAKHKADSLGKPQPDISIFTWGSIRTSLPAGEITLRNIYQLMPFENEMVVLKLNGRQTSTLLNQLALNFDPIAGATIIRGDPNQILINGNPLDENRFYYVLASDYLSFGGDNFSILTEATERYLCDMKVRGALISYLEKMKAAGNTLKPNYEQRIRN